VSLADLDPRWQRVASEQAARAADRPPACRLRQAVSTTQELTDIEMFEWLRPTRVPQLCSRRFEGVRSGRRAQAAFLDKANLFTLTRTGVDRPACRPPRARQRRNGTGRQWVSPGSRRSPDDRLLVNLTDTDLSGRRDGETAMTFTGRVRATSGGSSLEPRNDLVFGSTTPTAVDRRYEQRGKSSSSTQFIASSGRRS
jgi:catalase-peroxidase